MNFLRGFAFNGAVMAAVVCLSFVNQGMLGDGLGEEAYGVLGWWFTAVTLAVQASGEWLGRGSLDLVGRRGGRRLLGGNALAYAGCLGGVLALALLAFGDALAAATPSFPGAVWLAAALVAGGVLQRCGEALLQGEDRVRYYSLVPLVFVGTYFAGNSVSLGRGGGLEEVFFAWLAATLLAALFAWLPVWRSGLGVDGRLLRQTAAVGRRGGPAFLLVSLMMGMDMFVVERVGDGAELGFYRVVTVFAVLFQRPLNVAGTVLLPKIVRGGGEDLLSAKVAQGALFFGIAAAVVLVLGGEWAIALVYDNPAYAAAYAPLMWLLPGLVAVGYGSVLNTRLYGQGYPAVTVWAPALAVVAKIALNVLFHSAYPGLGLRGVALASSLAYSLWAAVVAVYYLRLIGSGPGVLLRPFWR